MKKNLLLFGLALSLLAPAVAAGLQRGANGSVWSLKNKAQREYTNQVETKSVVQKEDEVTPTALPWVNHMLTADDLAATTVIDANNDGLTWAMGRQGRRSYAYYNGMNAHAIGDDYIVSPALELKKGVNYDICFKAYNPNTTYKMRMDIKIGKAPTAEALQAGKTVMDTTDFIKTSPVDTALVVNKFVPDEDGIYYVGYHNVSDSVSTRFYLWDLTVREGAVDNAPAAVTDLAAVTDPQGEQKATITFKAPTASAAGGELTSVDSVVISHNGERAGVVGQLAAGAQGTFVDEAVPVRGFNTFTAVPYVQGNAGPEAQVKIYVGIDVPTTPRSFRMTDQKQNILASWYKAPAVGANGGVVLPEKVKYTIYDIDEDGEASVVVKSVVGDTATTLDINTVTGPQSMLQYVLRQASDAGESSGIYSRAMIIGAPYELPFREHFYNDATKDFEMNNFWYYSGEGLGYAWSLADLTFTSSVSGDDDSYSAHITTRFQNDAINMRSGKIKLSGTGNKLHFFSMNEAGPSNLVVNLLKQDGSKVALDTISLEQASAWSLYSYNVPDELAQDEYFQIEFRVYATNSGASSVFIDNIQVEADNVVDLAAAVNAPASVQRGKAVPVTVRINSNSPKGLSNYKVSLTANGVAVADTTVAENLPPFDSKTLAFEVATSAVDATEQIALKATVSVDGDSQADNNTSVDTVALTSYDGALPTGLEGQQVRGGVELQWDKPADVVKAVTEDFENLPAWQADKFGDWSAVSNDNSIAGTIMNGATLPGDYTQYAFQIMDFKKGMDIDRYPGHSGTAHVSAVYGINQSQSDFAPSDKWLISPTLSGAEQTITFYAMCHDNFAERLFVHYSTGSRNIADFVKISADTIRVTASDSVWQEVKFTVPAGAKRFAVERLDPDANSFWLELDDFSYEAGTELPTGYNVYRDGVLLGTVDAESIAKAVSKIVYNDTDVTAGTYVYQVTALYDGDETLPATVTVVVNTTGIESIDVDAARAGNVYDAQGRLVRSNATSTQGLPAGIYLHNGRKILVK